MEDRRSDQTTEFAAVKFVFRAIAITNAAL
jgi:hypothetical protein